MAAVKANAVTFVTAVAMVRALPLVRLGLGGAAAGWVSGVRCGPEVFHEGGSFGLVGGLRRGLVWYVAGCVRGADKFPFVCVSASAGSLATRRGCGPGAAIGLWLRLLPQRLVKGCAAAPHCALHVSRSVVPTGCSRAAARGGHPARTYPPFSSRQRPHGAWVFPLHVRLDTTLMMGVPPRRGRACACAAVPPLLILLASTQALPCHPLRARGGQSRLFLLLSPHPRFFFKTWRATRWPHPGNDPGRHAVPRLRATASPRPGRAHRLASPGGGSAQHLAGASKRSGLSQLFLLYSPSFIFI